MPSPFPGMDPYLENPRLWPDVHHGLISEMQAILNRSLRPKYFVTVEERIYVSDEADPGREVIIPDLRVADVPGMENQTWSSGAAAVAMVAEPVEIVTFLDDEIHEAHLAINDAVHRQVVTVIELLSLSNKVVGSRGRASYEQTRHEVYDSPSHWVEVDLLREGRPFFRRDRPCDYTVHVSRQERRPKSHYWPILLAQALPSIQIPLRSGDPDAPLNLQAVLNSAYDRASFDMRIDYRAEATPPLIGPNAEWARQWLSGKGLR